MTTPPKRAFGAVPAALAVFALALSSMPALPSAAAEQAPQGDPGVARVSEIIGGVQVRRGDTNDAFAATQNAPVSVGDYLSTENSARAEVEFNYASLIRVAPQTQIRFVKLDPHDHELQLAEGTVEMRVLHGLEAHPVIDTPGASIVPSREGRYRVTVTHDGNTEVTVRSGQADVESGTDNERHTIYPGSTLLVAGQGSNTHVSTLQTVAYDEFDKWTDARDEHWAHTDVAGAPAAAYVDHGMVGANDLDQYGQWVDTANYGQAWQPNEPAGWSPYTNGRWVWEPYYGWTWVGDEPWGYAPYHYGRWAFVNGGWCWIPGQYDDGDYAYAPALVGFFGYGDGDGFGIDLNFGNIGWTPLAPFDAFTPWWGNGGGTTIINNYYGGSGGRGGRGGGGYGSGQNGYGNLHNPGGANGTSANNFANGISGAISALGGSALNGIKPVTGTVPVVPNAEQIGSNVLGLKPLNGIVPISEGFSNLRPIASAIPTFEQQRTAVAATIKQQLPGLSTIAGLGDRTTPGTEHQSFGGERSTSTGISTTSAGERPAFNDARPESGDRSLGENRPQNDGSGISTAWERFNNPQRGTDAPRYSENSDGTRADTANESYRSNERSGDVSTHTDVWSRFGSTGSSRDSGGARDTNETTERDNEPSYAVHSYSGADRSASGSDRSYSEAARSTAEPYHSYSDTSSRSYSEPMRSYSEPSRSYSEPSRSYSQPERSYSEPRYSTPSRSYSAPSRSYSAPSRSYSAPHESSGGSHGSSDHSKHR